MSRACEPRLDLLAVLVVVLKEGGNWEDEAVWFCGTSGGRPMEGGM
jgi:hypothetical protein